MSPVDASTAEKLNRVLVGQQSRFRQPSLSAAVVRDGQVVWAGAVGTLDGRRDGPPATPLTAYRIGSITKPFVAVAVLRLVARGDLDLDEPVGRFVPDTGISHATIAQLLSHTSGLAAETQGPWWERSAGRSWAELVPSLRPVMSPGRRFHYSNTGYAVLGRLLEVVHGGRWDEVVNEQVLAPIGLVATGRVPIGDKATGLGVHPYADVVHPEPVPDYLAMGPAGEFYSTTGDLGLFAAFLAGRHPANAEGEVLGPDWPARLREPRAVADLPGLPWDSAYGLGLQLWNLEGTRHYGHTGSVPGFTAELRIDAESADAVVVLGNSTAGCGGGLDLLRAFHEHCPPPATSWATDAEQVGLLELTGQWFWGVTPFGLRLLPQGGLELTMTGGTRGTCFRPDGRDRWRGSSGYFAEESLTVVRDAAGIAHHLDLASFRLTRVPYQPDADIPGGVPEDPAIRWR